MSGFTENLTSYTMTQLNELLEDDEQLNKMVQDLEETQTVQQAKDVTLAGNRSLAEQNLLLQPALDLQKNELTKRYRCLQELFEAYLLRKSTLDDTLSSGSVDTLLALLQAEGAKIEEETEKMADLFLDGGQPLDSFIDEYQSGRKLAHLRRVKIDRLREMVLRGLRMPQAPAPAPAPLAQSTLAPVPAPVLTPAADTNGSPMPAPRRSPTQPASPTASHSLPLSLRAPSRASSCSDQFPRPRAPPTATPEAGRIAGGGGSPRTSVNTHAHREHDILLSARLLPQGSSNAAFLLTISPTVPLVLPAVTTPCPLCPVWAGPAPECSPRGEAVTLAVLCLFAAVGSAPCRWC
ncbi:hypothetical protein SKAU_G00363070 [Synaphobranchus kaupii]|uniref:VPS37 C-terminal domain-containing protein n=1 Tax=Synaphobranchus kaupii TaxID=118154 RepID=A0A9Q1EIP3_SYNKA|nr:hypothetical protein SKAU_G00363070 [Synaphobranchus kaupii]